jgi:hypothetical protein
LAGAGFVLMRKPMMNPPAMAARTIPATALMLMPVCEDEVFGAGRSTQTGFADSPDVLLRAQRGHVLSNGDSA